MSNRAAAGAARDRYDPRVSYDRWATFDCYGTLVDWDTGILSAIESVAPGHGQELLARYHGLEPRVQAEPGTFKRYREIMRETLSRAAAEAEVALAPGTRMSWAGPCPTGRCSRTWSRRWRGFAAPAGSWPSSPTSTTI